MRPHRAVSSFRAAAGRFLFAVSAMCPNSERNGSDHIMVVAYGVGDESVLEFLSRRLINESKVRLRRLIGAGVIRINGSAVGAGRRISAGDLVSMPAELDRSLPPVQSIPVEVIYDGPGHLCVNKPAGMLVLPGRGGEGAEFYRSLVALLNADAPPGGPYVRPHVVHRLDRQTSGVLLVAKSVDASRDLSRQFQRGEVQKTYVALLEGPLPRREVLLDAPLSRQPGSLVKIAPDPRHGRRAATRIIVRRRFGHFTFVAAHPLTGRQHQIRVHLAAAGYPLAVDSLYGRRDTLTGQGLNAIVGRRVAEPKAVLLARSPLHAAHIRYRDPTTGETTAQRAPVPEDIRAVLELLGRVDPPAA